MCELQVGGDQNMVVSSRVEWHCVMERHLLLCIPLWWAEPDEKRGWAFTVKFYWQMQGSHARRAYVMLVYVNHTKHSHKTLSNAYVPFPERSAPDTSCLC